MRIVGIILAVLAATAAGLLVGVKRLDEIAASRADLAVRSGGETYFIPSAFVRSGGLSVQLMRLAGCWDARDAPYVEAAASLSDCGKVHSIKLVLATSALGADVAQTIHKPSLTLFFWPEYRPPDEEIVAVDGAIAARGDFSGRQVTWREDWKLWRVEVAASPWVYLLIDQPRSGDMRELARLYAGRCYRPERVGDAGMTCEFALRVGSAAVVEFSLGADEMMSFVQVREALLARVAEWRREPQVSMKIAALGQDFLRARVFVERDFVRRRLGMRRELARAMRGG